MTYQKLISTWKLNKAMLASKMSMPKTTFNNKLNEKLTQYNFTEIEIQRLEKILSCLALDIVNSKSVEYYIIT